MQIHINTGQQRVERIFFFVFFESAVLSRNLSNKFCQRRWTTTTYGMFFIPPSYAARCAEHPWQSGTFLPLQFNRQSELWRRVSVFETSFFVSPLLIFRSSVFFLKLHHSGPSRFIASRLFMHVWQPAPPIIKRTSRLPMCLSGDEKGFKIMKTSVFDQKQREMTWNRSNL